ncbi:MAG: FAD-dependent oxidoreductase [Candidatus Scalindua sp.]|jgi:NADPH-dependent glutamate synthase beta subunit-like oxidoreductase|nr:FAD-dependent oxidoreductase [Candidatus Scalindua sp.]MBT5304929.1 FAD-dependent oxidoreductase [Candidatus Scalindua sp.]MBT6229176.1 FAD-dependent oxidoreductase [Candidatus Scalindua sp.]MBT6563876.1 FAD-dependent oxidoreductase [Candidatus Scalindua sp.]MBT7212433.1 FAD-dependent oxidoreductase [Candidatus Scalindua sp.]
MEIQNRENDTFVSTDKLDRKWIDINIPCSAACPALTDIPGYIQAIKDGDHKTAYRINRMENILPGILGRVCDRPCEPACRHGWDELGDPVSICFLKRAAADYGMEPVNPKIKSNGKKICVIGAGPAGLTIANDLALKGYQVTILEQFDQPGGMLRYGIPQFRLPYDVVAEDVKSITDLGVTIKTNVRVGDVKEIVRLKKSYDAVILAGGCANSKQTNIPGIDSKGVYWGLDFLIAANREELNIPLEKVIVIGGGFTAVDCTRMSYRLGAKKITLAYRRTKDDMYVGTHELEVMEAEGINTIFLASPVDIVSNDEGIVTGVKFIHNSINEDRSITPIEGSEFITGADIVIFAVGQKADGKIAETESAELKNNFSIAGDFRNGSSTVIEAVADGRKVAREVHMQLSGIKGFQDTIHISEVKDTGRKRDYDFIPVQPMDTTPMRDRKIKNREVETGFSKEKSLVEAKRCYLCHYNFQIDISRCIYCLACIDVMPVDCIKMAKDIKVTEDGNLKYIETKKWSEVEAITIDNDKCIRCGNCVRACPVDCISISKYKLKMIEKK